MYHIPLEYSTQYNMNKQIKTGNISDAIQNIKTGENGGFFDLPTDNMCKDKEHNPPQYLHIPQGKGYRHVCPSCGKQQIVIPPQITL